MKKVPIDVENIDFIRLDLSRHFIQIDCDFICYIVLNPSGTIPEGGTDVCAFHVGAWQVDSWKFLTKDFAQIPGFSACLVWDKSLVTDIAKAPQVAESDIDTSSSISSLKGQPVNITGFSMAEGESLPVSTLDEDFVSVRPFESFAEKSNFPVAPFFISLNVESELDLESLKPFIVGENNGVYQVFAPYMLGNGIRTGTVDFANCFSYRKGQIYYRGVNGSHGVVSYGGAFYTDVKITVDSNNIITGMSAVFGVGANVNTASSISTLTSDVSFSNFKNLVLSF